MVTIAEIRDLKKYYPVRAGFFGGGRGFVHAVDGVSFGIEEGQTLGLAGESGSGKTTIAKLLVRLVEPTAGVFKLLGNDVFGLGKNEMRDLRSRIQLIFQDPSGSLNPRLSIRQILGKPFDLSRKSRQKQIEVPRLLEMVGLTPPDIYLDRYPHELSGGQKQRIGIARAVALHPSFVIADEPVSSLDMSIRGQVLNLMKSLQQQLSLTYLFITHDLSVLRSVSSTVAIMYLGKIVESASVEELFDNALHPYTKSLLAATPIPDPKLRNRERIVLKGEIPSPINPPSGCRFHTRCPFKMLMCEEIAPDLIQVETGHLVACHIAQR